MTAERAAVTSVLRSSRGFSSARMATAARSLLNASMLCAIATVSPGGRAHINTAYFAWSSNFDVVWLSAPEARHSRNLRAGPTTAIAVYDSRQRWGGPDRGIQLFGRARALDGRAAREAQRLYMRRFPRYERTNPRDYRFYRFRPRRIKLFDERSFGAGVFVTAEVQAPARLLWTGTETYGSEG